MARKKLEGNKYGAGFDKNPQNINRDGANRRSYSAFNKKCKEAGIEQVTKNIYFTSVSYLMSLTESEMNAILQNSEEPQWLRWQIESLLEPSTRAKIMADYRDWLFGRAEQKLDHTNDGGKFESQVDKLFPPLDEVLSDD